MGRAWIAAALSPAAWPSWELGAPAHEKPTSGLLSWAVSVTVTVSSVSRCGPDLLAALSSTCAEDNSVVSPDAIGGATMSLFTTSHVSSPSMPMPWLTAVGPPGHSTKDGTTDPRTNMQSANAFKYHVESWTIATCCA